MMRVRDRHRLCVASLGRSRWQTDLRAPPSLAALRPGDTVITSKLDRMFRSASDALANLDVMKRKVGSLHMIDLGGDATGNGIAKLGLHHTVRGR
jgi:hypothetical protein